MRKLFSVFIIFNIILLNSCDDGDIITVELDFDDTFEACGSTNLILFKTKEDPSESLSLKLNGVTLEDILEVDENGLFEKTYTISSTNPFNYRTYSNTDLPSDLFCNDIPNSEIIITQDIQSTSGMADLKTELTEDDNDGIPAILEDRNNNGYLRDDNSDKKSEEEFFDATLYDYLDTDDDNDGKLTKDEVAFKEYVVDTSMGEQEPELEENKEYEIDRKNVNGIITIKTVVLTDTNNDGTPDYLDADS